MIWQHGIKRQPYHLKEEGSNRNTTHIYVQVAKHSRSVSISQYKHVFTPDAHFEPNLFTISERQQYGTGAKHVEIQYSVSSIPARWHFSTQNPLRPGLVS